MAKLQTTAECWDTEAPPAEYWLECPKDAHLSGLDCSKRALKISQGIGLLDAYMVKVGRHDSYTSCVWDGPQYYLDSIDCRDTRIGHWMSLDGSKPGFSEFQSEDFDAIDEQIMQGEEYFDIHSPDKEEVSEYSGGQHQTANVERVGKAWTVQASLLVLQGGTQHMWAGKVQTLAMDVAILLQRFVLASVQAFTRCLAAPGGLQHTGLRDADSDLTHMFIQQKEAYPLESLRLLVHRWPAAKTCQACTVTCIAEAHAIAEAHGTLYGRAAAADSTSSRLEFERCMPRKKVPSIRQLCQDLVTFFRHPESCMYQAQTDVQGWRHLLGWVPRHRQVRCEEEQSCAVVITCTKTKEWHDTLMQCYNRNFAWLQAITGAVKEVMLLLISEAIRASPSQRS
ncbi:hypothetical protein WJX77_006019 [Trebouxia sp. C0004]